MDNAIRLGALVDEVTVTRLLLQMEAIEQTGEKENIEEYDALSEAIAFIASPQRLEEMSTREVAARWNEVIVNA
jgi:hypothetical protein